MKILFENDIAMQQAEKIVKKGNEIVGYTKGKIVWKYTNISNIDDFKLDEGQEWDIQVDEIAQLKMQLQITQEAIDFLIMGGM